MNDPAAVARLMAEYGGKARELAGKLRKRLTACVSVEELEADALVGLWDAAQRYDPAKGVRFWSFAARRVWGEMMDGVRGRDWWPRFVARRGKAAPVVSMSRPGRRWQDGSRADSEGRDGSAWANVLPSQREGPVGAEAEHRDTVRHLLRGLGRQKRAIVELTVVHGLTQREAGVAVGLTESRANQIFKEAMAFLADRERGVA